MKKIIVTLVFLCTLFGLFVNVYAAESTGNGKFDSFINDGRYCEGTAWNYEQTPKESSFQGWGCCAYCADYVHYCFGISNPRAGAAFKNTSEIRAGDVLTVGNQSDGSGHWFICLKRDGNRLYVAEGNYLNKVRIGWNYTIASSNTFTGTSRQFNTGYHFAEASSTQSNPTVNFGEWNNSNYTYIRETDASIGQEINVSGGTCTDTGMELYDANGNFLAKAANGRFYYRVYFKINEELGVTLSPGTTYKYKFFAVVNGQTYRGNEGSFTTAGTAVKYSNLDINGYCDNQSISNISGYGTADVYINGALVLNDCTDFFNAYPSGTTYEIKDIKAASGYQCDGVKSGSLSGTIGNSDTVVVLSFSKIQVTVNETALNESTSLYSNTSTTEQSSGAASATTSEAIANTESATNTVSQKKAYRSGVSTSSKSANSSGTFSSYWFSTAPGVWGVRYPSGRIVTDSWVCDDAVSANGKNTWYLLDKEGKMLSAGLVQDYSGNYYSLETNHNGYFGMLRYKNGVYDCDGQQVYLEFSQDHDGTFGAIINEDGLEQLEDIYGITYIDIDDSNCVYTKTF